MTLKSDLYYTHEVPSKLKFWDCFVLVSIAALVLATIAAASWAVVGNPKLLTTLGVVVGIVAVLAGLAYMIYRWVNRDRAKERFVEFKIWFKCLKGGLWFATILFLFVSIIFGVTWALFEFQTPFKIMVGVPAIVLLFGTTKYIIEKDYR